jgi:hypothetical protein
MLTKSPLGDLPAGRQGLGGRIKLLTFVENVFTITAINEGNCICNKKVISIGNDKIYTNYLR